MGVYSTAQHSTVQYGTVQYSTRYSTVLAVHYSTVHNIDSREEHSIVNRTVGSTSPRQCRNALSAKLKLRLGKRLKLSSVCKLYNTRPSPDRAILVKLPQGAIRYLENSTPIEIATTQQPTQKSRGRGGGGGRKGAST